MIKRIVFMLITVTLLFAAGYFIHAKLISTDLSFSLLHVYLFHAIAVVLIYSAIEFVAEHLPSQAGYLYLMLMCFKIGFFLLIFQTTVFENDDLSQPERVALVVPLFIFLIVEGIAVAKLLNSK
ncbi:hypothetical protein BZARG_1662 [Bizionia argentinensis JUB59]|uniref:Uncharacterized protein n=1 Tax=Bizionia argentinensis JUB59 TaxID=1046627 RepID=G2EEU8_9FLAO|nr:DUF6168 family protein [Bizionia argentinensis]EGV43066.1 hypothetical protein BZARG_1662 [Bizionia argentinensis JUB59]